MSELIKRRQNGSTQINPNVRIIFLADSHLGFDYPIRPRVHRRRRGHDFFGNFEKVLSHALMTKADFVVHGGDLFFRAKIPQKISDLASSMIFEYANKGVKFFLTPGNHERSKLPDNLLLGHPNIKIFRKPSTFDLTVGGLRVSIAGFPFERKDIRNRFHEIVEQTGWLSHLADIRLLCMHQAVEGARVGPSNYTFRGTEDVVCIDELPPGFNAVLTGHIHRMQVLDKGSCPVIYPGSIERTSFAEKDEEKGFFEIELNRDGIRRLDFKRLPARPMIDLALDEKINKDNLRSYLKSEVSRMDANSIVRLRIKDGVKDDLSTALTAAFLREVFPDSMNYQLGFSIKRYNVKKR